MNKNLIISILILLFFSHLNLKAQIGGRANCAEKLRQAQIDYDNGLIQNVPELIEKCIPNYTKAQKTQAYRLLILSYLFDNNEGNADKFMQQLLKFDPLFIVQENEPVEFKNLFSNYRTEPIYSLGVIGGMSLSFIDEIHSYSTSDLNKTKTNYQTLPGFQVSAFFNGYISDNFKINITANLNQNRYNIIQNHLNFSSTKLTESLMSIGLGIAGTYELKKIKKTIIKPYFRMGIEPNYLSIAKVSAIRTYTDESKIPVEDQGINTNTIRNSFNLAPFMSSGIKYRIGRAWLIFDLKYSRNIFYSNSPTNRFKNQDLLFKYYYVDSDFALQYFSLSLGVIQSFYNPIKRK